jgi:hypothetical protein
VLQKKFAFYTEGYEPEPELKILLGAEAANDHHLQLGNTSP